MWQAPPVLVPRETPPQLACLECMRAAAGLNAGVDGNCAGCRARDEHRHDWQATSSLMHRIERWARNNPDEYLTAEDAGVKFSCSPDQFRRAVRNLRTCGRNTMEAVTVWKPLVS